MQANDCGVPNGNQRARCGLQSSKVTFNFRIIAKNAHLIARAHTHTKRECIGAAKGQRAEFIAIAALIGSVIGRFDVIRVEKSKFRMFSPATEWFMIIISDSRRAKIGMSIDDCRWISTYLRIALEWRRLLDYDSVAEGDLFILCFAVSLRITIEYSMRKLAVNSNW